MTRDRGAASDQCLHIGTVQLLVGIVEGDLHVMRAGGDIRIRTPGYAGKRTRDAGFAAPEAEPTGPRWLERAVRTEAAQRADQAEGLPS
jgi:hypothetical protein